MYKLITNINLSKALLKWYWIKFKNKDWKIKNDYTIVPMWKICLKSDLKKWIPLKFKKLQENIKKEKN